MGTGRNDGVASRPARPTIADVAALAGVSRTTVSRVMNHPESVAGETADRVHDAVRDLGFAPDHRARSMRTGRSDTIALLLGDSSQVFHAALAKSVARAADAHGLNVLLCDLDHQEDRLVSLLHRLPQQGVDGIIVSTGDDIAGTRVSSAVEEARHGGTPVLVSGREWSGDQPGVSIDFATIAQRATELLITGGSRRPVAILADTVSYVGSRWAQGYRAALRDHGLDELVLNSPQFSATIATDVVGEQLRGDRPADGVVAATVPLALGALRAAHVAGLAVPEDLAVVACEEVALAELVTPSISTVSVDPSGNGRMLVDHLRELIAGRTPNGVDVPFETRERQTTVRR